MVYSINSFSQKKEIDSTFAILRTHLKEDSVRVNALIHLSFLYQSTNLKNAEYLAKEAVFISEKINDPLLITRSQNQLGSVFNWTYHTTEALAIYLKSLDVAKKINAQDELQDAYNGIAYVYELEGEWDHSLSYSLQSLQLAEKSKDLKKISYAFHSLGSAYLGLGKDSNAEV